MTNDKINKILLENLGYGFEDKIYPGANLQEDLGADSLDDVSIAMDLEEEFQIEISNDEMNRVETVQNLVALVESKL